MLELENVSKVVGGETHIRDVTLSLRHGTLNVLLGPTLAGKTSLMRLMAGLDQPTSGRVLFDGADVTGVPVQKRNIAMVYQQFINYPAMTVYENIASPLRVAGTDRATIDREVRQAADEQANVYGGCGPRLNEPKDPSEWLGKPNGPKAKLENEKPQGETIAYDELVKRWTSE